MWIRHSKGSKGLVNGGSITDKALPNTKPWPPKGRKAGMGHDMHEKFRGEICLWSSWREKKHVKQLKQNIGTVTWLTWPSWSWASWRIERCKDGKFQNQVIDLASTIARTEQNNSCQLEPLRFTTDLHTKPGPTVPYSTYTGEQIDIVSCWCVWTNPYILAMLES